MAAGLLPVADFFRLQDSFERLGRFGIAVRGRTRSTLLFSRKPIRQLDGATVAITEESSTTACLTRLLLEQRYRIVPAAYNRVRGPSSSWVDEGIPSAPALARGGPGQPKAEGPRGTPADADALLLIGDEALRFQRTNTLYPFEIDVAFEWWLWQHLPFVFAVWAIRKDASTQVKKELELGLIKSLAMNQGRFEEIAREYSTTLDVPETDLHVYLSRFIYRLSQPEEEGMRRFKELLDEHRLL